LTLFCALLAFATVLPAGALLKGALLQRLGCNYWPCSGRGSELKGENFIVGFIRHEEDRVSRSHVKLKQNMALRQGKTTYWARQLRR
jgi:hypothetical protein